jgi:hypothetical protein
MIVIVLAVLQYAMSFLPMGSSLLVRVKGSPSGLVEHVY